MTNTLQSMPFKAADQKYCPSCAKILHISAPTCPACGAAQPLTPASGATNPYGLQSLAYSGATAASNSPAQPTLQVGQVFCRGCGQPIHQSALSCPKCGALQHASSLHSIDNSFTGSRNRTVAAVLAFFLGGFGAHRFYLGHIFVGLIYLIFCWTFIPAFVALIEGIYYLTLNDQEFSIKYR